MSETQGTHAAPTRRLKTSDIIIGALVAALLVVVVATLGRTWGEWKPASRWSNGSKMWRLSVAMVGYAWDKGRLPPAFIRGHDGRPLLSWRVLLLPYLEEEELYRQFNLSEPWDGPTNRKLLPKMPRIYADGRPSGLAGPRPEPYHTFFRVFIGKGTPFDDTDGVVFPDQVPDGPSRTILVFEAAEAVPWTQPEGIPYAADKPLPAFRTRGSYAAMADGSALFIEPKVREENFRGAITRNGGEVLAPEWNTGAPNAVSNRRP